LDNVKEYRGQVFSIGSNTSHSLVNYFTKYNPDLLGGSTGDTYPVAVKSDYMQVVTPNAAISHLNAGQSGAVVSDIKGQVDYLKNQLLTTYKNTINFNEDWKLLTIFIGANNLCVACSDEVRGSPDNYERDLDDALAYLRLQIPRVFVSIITMFKLSTVYTTFQTSFYCKTTRAVVFNSECLCIAKDYTAAGLQKVDNYAVQYNDIIYRLAEKYQKLNDPSFTVKVQPCTQNFAIPPSIGTQFLSEFDCFHPSVLADASISVALWNNMLTPQDKKQTTFDPFTLQFVCPNDNTFLQ